jgi:hypothetical protein
MDKQVNEVVGMIETYLRESANLPEESKPAFEEIELHIMSLLIDNNLVDKTFSIEVFPLDNSYILRPRNHYTSTIIGGLPMFCKECGKLKEPVHYKGMMENKIGYVPCSHE